jgi:hypothetical protein
MKGACFKRFLYGQYLCFRILGDHRKKYLTDSTKSPWKRYLDVQRWMLRNGEFCSFYNAWGLNDMQARLNGFIGRKEFLKLKTIAEKELLRQNGLEGFNYDILTKDKFVAGSFLQANGIPCAPHHGIVVRGQYIPVGKNGYSLAELFEIERDLFFKSVLMEAGEGVFHARLSGKDVIINGQHHTWKELLGKLHDGVWNVQSRLVSHKAIRAVNSSALNTTRIVTIIEGSRPAYLTGFQAFATGKATMDSWSKGSIYVGINVIAGCLKEYGFHNLAESSQSVSEHHPDSGIMFKGYRIPYLLEAVDLCLNAHRLFYNNFVIGWDVAITDSGPLIVEVNEKPGMNAVQCVDGGLRKRILEYYNSVKSGIEDYR